MTGWVILFPFFSRKQGQISQTTYFCIFLDLVSCPVNPVHTLSAVLQSVGAAVLLLCFVQKVGAWRAFPISCPLRVLTLDPCIMAAESECSGGCGCNYCSVITNFPFTQPFHLMI